MRNIRKPLHKQYQKEMDKQTEKMLEYQKNKMYKRRLGLLPKPLRRELNINNILDENGE